MKTNESSHLANIRMILQVRMNTLIDQQQLELFLKQYPGNDDVYATEILIIYLKHWIINHKLSVFPY